MGGALKGRPRSAAPSSWAPAPRPRHVERTSHACTVTQEVKETGTRSPTSHRNKGWGPCGPWGAGRGGRGVGTGGCGGGAANSWGQRRGRAWAGRGGPAGRGVYGGATGLRGPAPPAGQVIGFYFKLHFVLSEVGWEGRRPHSGGRLCKSPHLSRALLLRGGSGRWVRSAGGSGGRGGSVV